MGKLHTGLLLSIALALLSSSCRFSPLAYFSIPSWQFVLFLQGSTWGGTNARINCSVGRYLAQEKMITRSTINYFKNKDTRSKTHKHNTSPQTYHSSNRARAVAGAGVHAYTHTHTHTHTHPSLHWTFHLCEITSEKERRKACLVWFPVTLLNLRLL